MNLIEQLGGYEKLKPHFVLTDRTIGYTHIYLHGNNHYCFLDESVDYIIPDRAILIKDVFDALLEYRRQNNIFESEDKIVVKNDCLIDFADLTLNLKVLTVLMVTDEGFIRSIESAGLFKSSLVRHATDKEIKAGRRL